MQYQSGRQQQKKNSRKKEELPLSAEEKARKTFSLAIKLLVIKSRSAQQLREKLLQKEWTDEKAVEETLLKLQEYGYIDDKQFAYNYASSKVSLKPIGAGKVARLLSRKKIASPLIKEAVAQVFEEHSEEELLRAAMEKRVRIKGPASDAATKKKLIDYLLRQGFSYNLIRKVLR